MAGLTWLHLSDWHQEGKKFDRRVVGEALIAEIERRKTISPDLAKIDFIIFSGDVANTGQADEYEDAIRKLFQPLLDATGLKPDQLLIVPGNHDLDRELIPAGLLKPLQSNDEVEVWWNDDKKRAQLNQPFQAFYNFLLNYKGSNLPRYADIFVCEVDGKKIAFLLINSAWMCARNKVKAKQINDIGYLCVGESQIYEPLKQISDANIMIAVLHHPLDWLAPFDQNRVELHLKRKCNFILHGHGHKPGVSEPMIWQSFVATFLSLSEMRPKPWPKKKIWEFPSTKDVLKIKWND